MFKIVDGRDYFYQWDLDRRIEVADATIAEVHFCNRTDDCSLVVEVKNGIANVPNIILQKSFDVRVFGYDGKATRYDEVFKVKARSKPSDYIYTETELRTLDHLETKVNEVEGIAKGAVGGKSFMTYQEMVEALNTATAKDYAQAQHLLIQTLGVPDIWIYEVSANYVPYQYTDDEAIAVTVSEGTLQIGYYVLSALETQKVNLTDYVKNTDYGSNNKAGLARGNPTYGTYINPDTGVISIVAVPENQLKNKASGYMPLVSKQIDSIVKIGLTTNQEELTEEEKASAQNWLGITELFGDVATALDELHSYAEGM